MKQYVFIFFLASTCIVSCNKYSIIQDELPIDAPVDNSETATPGYHIVTLNASVDPEVKSAYDPSDDVTFTWSAYDEISVLFHKGSENAFFPLTTTTGGSATATFSGSIEDGWELGSNETTTRYWALFPASSSHVYTKDATDPITFNIPATTDFTAGEHPHFSANVPMAAEWDGSGGSTTFTMGLLCGAYKITFTNVAASKVKLEVTNAKSSTRILSGDYPVVNSSGNYLENGTDYGASGSLTVSYIRDVDEGDAVFYIPYKNWEALGPQLTLINMDSGANNGFTIFTATAKNKLDGVGSKKVVLVPSKDVSSYGVGSPLISHFGVIWQNVDMYPENDSKEAFPGTGDRITEWKASSDATNIYFFFKIPVSVARSRGKNSAYIVTSFDLDNNTETGGAPSGYGHSTGKEAWTLVFPFTNSADTDPTLKSGSDSDSKINYPYDSEKSTYTLTASKVTTYGSVVGDNTYVEISIPRSSLGSPTSGNTIGVQHSMASQAATKQTISLN